MKIEKGIPIPEKSYIKYPWGKMEVGDSFFLFFEYTKREHQSISGSQASWKRYNKSNYKFTIRKVDGGIRAWRLS